MNQSLKQLWKQTPRITFRKSHARQFQDCTQSKWSSRPTSSQWHMQHLRLQSKRRLPRDDIVLRLCSRRWLSDSSKPPPESPSKAKSTTSKATHTAETQPTSAPNNTSSTTIPSDSPKPSFTDALVNRVTKLSHLLNTYTGTDYTPINALRNAIAAQETLVESQLSVLSSAQTAYDEARDAQASSQKEVVQLLERKSSWSSADLERYMSLVRSEHLHEQAVLATKGELREAEKGLEGARAELERMERKRYHEEQLWSDTIRRNSTWVTTGLMGVNVLVLVVGLVLVEPWRRRRLAGEVTAALERERALQIEMPSISKPAVNEQPSEIEPLPVVEAPDIQVFSVDASGAVVATEDPEQPDLESPLQFVNISQPYWAESWSGTWAIYRDYWHELFSERPVMLRRVDLTTTALEGAAAGAAFMGLLFVMLRPR